MKISILTLGCKTNQAESIGIERELIRSGHKIVELKDSPDICIINTCTVTSKSDYQSRQLIRRALRTGAEVMVTGCYTELRDKDVRSISSDLKIVSNNSKGDIAGLIRLKEGSSVTGKNKKYILQSFRGRSRPFVKIQDGCNYSCTYCAVTLARGVSRSVPRDEILKEIVSLEEMGFAEAVLTGIHIGHYGLDLTPRETISGLVEYILMNTRKIRIRLSSIEVNEIDEQLIDLLSDARLCLHLHIPLQSGDDRILKSMKRPYNTATYIAKVNAILKRYDNIALGTDIIVGFPGESKKEFNNTIGIVRDLPFYYLHVFRYSDRPGTAASMMSNHLSSNEKKRRSILLRSIDKKKRLAYMEKQIGRNLVVVFEKAVDDCLFVGKSENYINVYYEKPAVSRNEINYVKILKTFRDGLYGIAHKK
jgi:threonylcarbamoyladenosine tRNA methylthiotransferase MtaB